MGTENLTFTKNDIDWAKMKLYEQSETIGKIDILGNETEGFNKGFNGLDHKQFDALIKKTDPSTEDDYILPPGSAPGMLNKFYSSVADNYEKSLQIREVVLRDIFNNTDEAYIFLGEIENEGLVFIWEDSKGEYYIINDRDSKEHILKKVVSERKDFYYRNLKSTLDKYIPQGDPNPGNTKRFILKDRVYQEFVKQSGKDPSSIFAVTFYPAMHIIDGLYCNRLTFIMVVEKYVNDKWEAPGDTALYDRNGLCPPGSC